MKSWADLRGNTLIEVSVAMFLAAIIASSVFSIALTGKRDSGRGLRKIAAGQAARQMSAQLKNFVTADNAQVTIGGPTGGPAAGAASWQWSNTTTFQDDCGTCATPSNVPSGSVCPAGTCSFPSSCYALSAGSHTIKGFLPGWLTIAPYCATITYFVVNKSAGAIPCGTLGSGNCEPLVNVNVQWNEL